MAANFPLVEVIDPKQLARIESVHRGFLYQHLYAVGCLLLAGASAVRRVSVERDEDVELELDSGEHHYLQLKDRAPPLIYSEIESALQRFDLIREEHLQGWRAGTAKFAVVSRSAPGPDLQKRIDRGEFAADIIFVWPGAPTVLRAGMPPAWPDFATGAAWCVERATRLPMSMALPQTLIWKLAGLMQASSAGHATGQATSHAFDVDELPELFEQLVVQLQQFPDPPAIYRPIRDEPPLINEQRVRVVTAFSGAGKTAWAAQAATHNPSETAYYDVGDVPGPAIALSLTRELAAHWAAGSADALRGVLMQSTSGVESLRALDKFLMSSGSRALVVLDNAHRVPVADLRMLIDATQHLQMVLLAQPHGSMVQLQAQTGIQPEHLKGWGIDQAAEEVHAQGAKASAIELGRLLGVTGGLPLYVRAAVQLSVGQYGGDVAAMCAALESSANLEATRQEIILSGIFDALPAPLRDCVAVLSLSDVPLSEQEASGLVQKALGMQMAGFAAAIRQLGPLGVVRMFSGPRLQIHDAMRVLGRRRFDELPADTTQAALKALMDLIHDSIVVGEDVARFPLFVRTLIELGELSFLTDLATEEWFHELSVGEGVWAALEAAAVNPDVAPKIRFDALDALAFASGQDSRHDDTRRHLEAMARLMAQFDLGRRQHRVYQLKKTMLESEGGDEAATRRDIKRLRELTPPDPQNQRVVAYSEALALFKLGLHGEVLEIAEPLIQNYCIHLGFEPLPLFEPEDGPLALNAPESDTVVDDVKHLADALDLLAQSLEAVDRDPGRARMFSAFFYRSVNALSSFVRLSQDLVDELIGRSRPGMACEFIERELLPTVIEHEMHGHLVGVRSQYAVVLALCRKFDAAQAEFDRLEHYVPGLTPLQLREIANQRRYVEFLRLRAELGGI